MKFRNIEITPEEERLINEIGWEKFERSIDATNTYFRLMNSFAKNLQGTEYDYPRYYGGAYNDEEGVLVINVTEDIARCREDLVLRIDDSLVKYRLVPFNYTFLQNVMASIENYVNLNGADETAQNIKAWGIRQKTNRVVVYMEDISDDKVNEFKAKVTSSDAVQFEPMVGHFVGDNTAVYAGGPLENGSLAYRARTSDNKDGVVTAAHVVTMNSYIKTTNGTSFAECTQRHYGVSCDAAFCEITDQTFVPSNYIYGLSYDGSGELDVVLSTATVDPVEGAYVFKVGKSTGLTSGAIIDTDFACEYNSIRFYHLTATSYQRSSGDSGGLVYYLSGSNRYTVGVHCAGYDNGAEEHPNIRGLYSKASKINSSFIITRY